MKGDKNNMEIKSATKNYSVNIFNSFNSVDNIEIDDKTFVVIDKNVFELYREKLFNTIPEGRRFVFEATEENKVIESVLEICEIMTNFSAKRNAKLISIGGGIVQDVTGFVSGVLYRGIHWTFYPTTLLAACDSCIGGKTSLNYKQYKNLLGTFYPPDVINICTPFFKTLSERDYLSGLGEVVKFNVMQGEDGVKAMESNLNALINRDDNVVQRYVETSLNYKKSFIEQDEFDRGVRVKLNFAHTFGHAIETASNYVIPHGTAVAMGTIIANRISLSRNILAKDKVLRMEELLKRIIHIDKKLSPLDIDSLLPAIRKDKKQSDNNITAILMNDRWELLLVHDVDKAEIEPALNYMFSVV